MMFMMNLRLHPTWTEIFEAPGYELQTQTGLGYLLAETPKIEILVNEIN